MSEGKGRDDPDQLTPALDQYDQAENEQQVVYPGENVLEPQSHVRLQDVPRALALGHHKGWAGRTKHRPKRSTVRETYPEQNVGPAAIDPLHLDRGPFETPATALNLPPLHDSGLLATQGWEVHGLAKGGKPRPHLPARDTRHRRFPGHFRPPRFGLGHFKERRRQGMSPDSRCLHHEE